MLTSPLFHLSVRLPAHLMRLVAYSSQHCGRGHCTDVSGDDTSIISSYLIPDIFYIISVNSGTSKSMRKKADKSINNTLFTYRKR